MLLKRVPREIGDSDKAFPRIGAPAKAMTAFMPTVRKSVLLPDMLDPLTINMRVL